MKKLLPLLGLVACYWSCDPARVYETYHDIPGNQWYIDSTQAFSFAIEDPSVPYNVYYNIRNSVA